MSDIKEQAQIEIQSAEVAVQEMGANTFSEFKAMPRWKRIVALTLLIAIIPSYLIVRIGISAYLSSRYNRDALVAHESYSGVSAPVLSELNILPSSNNLYSAYVEVSNPNIELGASNIPYTAVFKDGSGKQVATSTGSFYLLPDDKKYLVIPRIESSTEIKSGEITLGTVSWQKRINIPQVEISTAPLLVTQTEDPLAFQAEGAIINRSTFKLKTVRIVFLLYDYRGKIVAVSQRDENNVEASGGRRGFIQTWPGLAVTEIKDVRVIPYTNVMDNANLLVE